jgi:bisphosphoglycerate-independent phosphoglycerate mutase (AlkP superfamily)
MNKKVLLMILDGWGVTQDPSVSAIAQADTPFIDSLYKKISSRTIVNPRHERWFAQRPNGQ